MFLFRALWTILLVVSLCACDRGQTVNQGGTVSPPQAAAPVKRPKVALLMQTLSNPFFVEMENGARRAEAELGVELIVKVGSHDLAIEQQIQIIEELIELHIDALIIAPSDSRRLVPVLKKAQSAGVVVINIDNPLDPEVVTRSQMAPVPFISVDNEAASYKVVKAISGQISKPTKAAILQGIPGADNSRMRVAGAMRAFKDNHAIELVSIETAHWRIDEARDVARQIFAQHPDIRLVFCANDMMARGVIEYLKESGHKKVTVIGYDSLKEARAAIAIGTLAATVDQQAAEQGYQGVALAVQALAGKKLPSTVMIDAQVVTTETLK